MSQIKTMDEFFKEYLPTKALRYYIAESDGKLYKRIGDSVSALDTEYDLDYHLGSDFWDVEWPNSILREISENQARAVLGLTKERD
jgi:hypothetical protein